MGILRNTIKRILDKFDPPTIAPKPAAPCPNCGLDVSKNHTKAQGGKDDLIFFLCKCDHASAWYWNGHGAQLIYGAVIADADFEEPE